MTVKPEGLNTEHLSFEAMNTVFDIQVIDCKAPNWKKAIFAWIKYVEKEWSRFEFNNELFQLNQLKVGEAIIISPPFFDVLKLAEKFRLLTDGLFSPYLLPQMIFHGYDQSFPFKESKGNKKPMPDVYHLKMAPFTFDQRTGKVKRIAEGKVDLGGIAKGYAVQSAAQWLKDIGQSRAGIVDGGGDITVWSDGSKEWVIGVGHPINETEEIAQFRIKNGSIATSSSHYRSWVSGNEKKHHILNGQTGLPANGEIIQATFVTDTCLHAEIGAKLFFMGEEKKIETILQEISSNFAYLLVRKDGEIVHRGTEAKVG